MLKGEKPKSRGERIASIAVKCLWASLFAFAGYSILGEESDYSNLSLYFALFLFSLAVILGVAALMVGTKERKHHLNLRKERNDRIASEQQKWNEEKMTKP